MAITKLLRIFIVENHQDTLDALRMYMEDSGHVVATASTVADALESIPAFKPDVFLCDIGLPDGNGWELIQKLPEDNAMFSIAMSGFGLHADRDISHAVGFRYHLLKPFKVAELDALLQEASQNLLRST